MDTRPREQSEDSVSLDSLQDEDSQGGGGKSGARLRVANLKMLAILFLIFIVVRSDVFVDSIIAGFGEKAVRGRAPTSWGTVLQGIFLVIFYILAVYLTENNIL